MKISDRKNKKTKNIFSIRPRHPGRRPINKNTTRTSVFSLFSLVFPYFVLNVLMNINKLVYRDNETWCCCVCRLSCSCIQELFWLFNRDDGTKCLFISVFIDEVASHIAGRTWPRLGRITKWE